MTTLQKAHYLLLLLSLMAACSTQAPAPTQADWQQHNLGIQALTEWEFSGKIAINTGRSADSARLRWRQSGQRAEIKLSGPVGWSQVTITTDEHSISLQRDGRTRSLAIDDYDGLEAELGWPMPTQLLPYWIKGAVAPTPKAELITLANGHLLDLQQGQWTLHYSAYQLVEGYFLPRQIQFEGHGVSGKIILKRWQTGSAK